MDCTLPQSPRARAALALLTELQASLTSRLEAVAAVAGAPRPFATVTWQRDGGHHGGGQRRCLADTPVFNRASVNLSAVHYDDEPDRPLAGATALSTIVHPAHPRAPSMHMHLSHTDLRDGRGYWRLMADLNPSHPEEAATARFAAALRAAAPAHYEEARVEGDRYFHIPALDRTRGVTHFYLEGHDSGDFEADAGLTRTLGEAVIVTYGDLLDAAVAGPPPTLAERAQQLAYHTIYFFQVLTLDRGTTSGLLIHADNDVGTLGSLPSHVDRSLLARWRSGLPAPQEALLDALLAALPPGDPAQVTEAAKQALADAVRAHYQRNPGALDLQARAARLPPTVANHKPQG